MRINVPEVRWFLEWMAELIVEPQLPCQVSALQPPASPGIWGHTAPRGGGGMKHVPGTSHGLGTSHVITWTPGTAPTTCKVLASFLNIISPCPKRGENEDCIRQDATWTKAHKIEHKSRICDSENHPWVPLRGALGRKGATWGGQ